MITITRTDIVCPIHGVEFWKIEHNGKQQPPVCQKCDPERWIYFVRNANKFKGLRSDASSR